jgi:beta-glucanase (GH16 family)
MNNDKKMLSVSLVAGFTAMLAMPVQGMSCQNPVPVWQDEFNGSALDTSKWEVMTGDGCDYGICGWGNSELQNYQADNLSVDNGTLKITAKKQRVRAQNYTSGRIRTANMPNGGQWTHGRFEARIKLPDGTGMWPAFWMLPTDPDLGWPQSGEIDILEATGQADMIAFGTIHYGMPWPDNEWTSGRILKQPDAWSADFHEYAIEWQPGEIRWYVDDILYSVKTANDLSDPAFWRFDDYPYHFLLNLAVGGSIGGVVDDAMLPQIMEVDYVRVYDFGQPSLTGSHIVEPNSQASYQVVDEAGNSNTYQWSSVTGETSTSNSLVVNWLTQGGDVSVDITNSCGNYQLTMNVHVLPELSEERVLDDFDQQRNLSYSNWSGQFNDGVANPAPDGINSSATVLEYIRDANSQWDVIVADTSDITDVAPFIAGEKAFYLDVYMPSPAQKEILIQLENSASATETNYPTGRHSKYIAHSQNIAGWQRLKFVLEDRIDGGTADHQVDSMVILLDPDAFTGDSYYLDNLTIYGQSPGEQQPSSMSVSSVTTTTIAAGKGKKYGGATVTVLDNHGLPVTGVTVSGQFTGSWDEQQTSQTDENGQVPFQTTTTLSGGVTVNFCVSSVAGSLPHDSSASVGLCGQ